MATNTNTSIKGGASSLGSGFIASGASLINGVIGAIFGDKNKERELDLKEQEQRFRQSLSVLDNQQKYLLQQKLDNAKTDTERLKILEDSITQIKVAQINAGASNQYKTQLLLLGSVVVLVGVLIVLKKSENGTR